MCLKGETAALQVVATKFRIRDWHGGCPEGTLLLQVWPVYGDRLYARPWLVAHKTTKKMRWQNDSDLEPEADDNVKETVRRSHQEE